MQDRIRIGEVLSGVGAVGLTLLLIFGDWFELKVGLQLPMLDPLVAGETFGADRLGWFLVFLLACAALAGLVFLFRVLTAPTTERIMLQGPVAFAVSLIALIGLLIRFIFRPELPVEAQLARRAAELLEQRRGIDTIFETGLTTAGWLGLLSLLLITVGSWIAIADERTDTAAAREQTERLLAEVPVRPAPPAQGAVPASDASVVADDAIGIDPADPSGPASTGGAPA